MTDRQHDILQRFLFEDTGVRGVLVSLDATFRAVLDRHPYPAAVQTQLGEAMAAAALLGSTIKYEGSLILQAQGDGPVHLLVAQITSAQHLRALARWNEQRQEAEGARLGMGRLVITVEQGKGKEPYQGIVALDQGGLATSIDTYFAQSEQLPTRVWLAGDQQRAAGLLIQELPREHADPEAWNTALALADTITSRELLHLTAEEIVHRLFHQEDIRLFDPVPVSFRCTCSRERIEEVLVALGHHEVNEALNEHNIVTVDCEFCGQKYQFDTVDVERLFPPANSVTPEVPSTRH